MLRIAEHTQGEWHKAALRASKGMDFFRVHYGHKGDAAVKFEALLSACQIVNERLLECVQLMQKNKQGSCISSDFFQIIIRVSSCSITMYYKSKHIAQCL